MVLGVRDTTVRLQIYQGASGKEKKCPFGRNAGEALTPKHRTMSNVVLHPSPLMRAMCAANHQIEEVAQRDLIAWAAGELGRSWVALL